MGRPTKRTPELESEIIESLALGLSDKWAAAGVGINRDTLREWEKEDEGFSVRCQRARASGLRKASAELADTRDPVRMQAAKFYLATHDREKWSTQQHVKHSGSVVVGLADLLAQDAERSRADASGE